MMQHITQWICLLHLLLLILLILFPSLFSLSPRSQPHLKMHRISLPPWSIALASIVTSIAIGAWCTCQARPTSSAWCQIIPSAFPHISFPIGCNLPVLKTISIPGAHDCPIIPNWIHCHTKMPKNGNIMIKPMKSSVGFILEQIRACLNVSEKTVFDGAIIAVILLVAHRPQIISFMWQASTASISSPVSTTAPIIVALLPPPNEPLQ